MKENVSGCFFSEHSVVTVIITVTCALLQKLEMITLWFTGGGDDDNDVLVTSDEERDLINEIHNEEDEITRSL